MRGKTDQKDKSGREGLLDEPGAEPGVASTLPVPGRPKTVGGVASERGESVQSAPRLSRLASGTHRPPRSASAASCADPQEQQCAEEECDADECGDERKPPADSVDCFGNDKRPYLPLMLFGTTLIGALHMLMIQFPLIRDELSWGYSIRAFFLCIYVMTLSCLVYCVLCDPGKLPVKEMEVFVQTHASGELPRRCHKMWLFKQPIRRYDHYCRWLTNAVGLLNHREFVLMLAGLLTIGLGGCLVDFILVVWTSSEGRHFTGFLLIMHLTLLGFSWAMLFCLPKKRKLQFHRVTTFFDSFLCSLVLARYSVILSLLTGPILRLHITFVSRSTENWHTSEHKPSCEDNFMKHVHSMSAIQEWACQWVQA